MLPDDIVDSYLSGWRECVLNVSFSACVLFYSNPSGHWLVCWASCIKRSHPATMTSIRYCVDYLLATSKRRWPSLYFWTEKLGQCGWRHRVCEWRAYSSTRLRTVSPLCIAKGNLWNLWGLQEIGSNFKVARRRGWAMFTERPGRYVKIYRGNAKSTRTTLNSIDWGGLENSRAVISSSERGVIARGRPHELCLGVGHLTIRFPWEHSWMSAWWRCNSVVSTLIDDVVNPLIFVDRCGATALVMRNMKTPSTGRDNSCNSENEQHSCYLASRRRDNYS